MIPYTEITETADRRWSFRLLDRLVAPDLSADERDEVVAALVAVSDWRTVPVLERLLIDHSQPAATREAAGEILRKMPYPDVRWREATLRQWWSGGDVILRWHALLSMRATICPEIVRATAADPTHPLRVTALGRMTFFFNTAADLRIKFAALSDPDPAVRECVADILFYDEPVAAEGALIAAAGGAAEEVAVAATATLQYYPTTRVIRCLHALLDHPVERVRAAARESLAGIRHECLFEVSSGTPHVAEHVRRWLEPVWDLFAFTPEELAPPADEPYIPRTAQKPQPPVLSEMLTLLSDPGTSPKMLERPLWDAEWTQYSAADRLKLRPVLLNHDDPLVRESGTVPLQEWGDADGLLALANDPDFGVRKSAFYQLGLLPADRRIAVVAWEHLKRLDVLGVHAGETLHTFVAHADPAEAIPRLIAIVNDRHRPESLRLSAAHDLFQVGGASEMEQLLGLISEPPAVTWALQTFMLDTAACLELPVPDVRHLTAVDNLHVQAALGLIVA